MKPIVFWIGISATHGWPWSKFRGWWKRNETEVGVWHVGAMGFGYHFEVRWGPFLES